AGHAATARHTWEQVAERTAGAVRRIDPATAARVLRHRDRRLAIAVAGRFTPAAAPVAKRNRALAAALARTAGVDLLLTGTEVDGVPRPPGGRALAIAVLGGVVVPAAYDAILYLFGGDA